jgi:LPS export ABC transporter protein LptC
MKAMLREMRAGICVCALLLAGCGKRPPAPKKPDLKALAPTISGLAKGLSVTGRDAQGRMLYEVRTRESTQQGVTANATLSNTRVTLYHEGTRDLVVEAPNARIDAKSQDLVMWGGLAAKAVSTGATFRVDRMTWNAHTRGFVGTGNVHYTRAPIAMQADRITGKTPLTTVNLDHNVRLQVAG